MSYYVYEFWRLDTNQPFYVGKGSAKRAKNLHARNRYCRNMIIALKRREIGIEIKRVFRTTDEDRALAYEAERIAYWKCRGIRLTNLTPGGDKGTSGYRWTKKQRLTAREAAKRRWRDPIYRRKTLNAHKIALADPDVNKAGWTIERRKNNKERMLRFWAEPANKAKMVRSLLPSHEISIRTKAGMAKSGAGAKVSRALKKYFATPEGRAQLRNVSEKERLAASQRMKQNWNDPEFVAKLRDSFRHRTKSIRKAYKDPKLISRIASAVKAAKASPEARAKIRTCAIAAWKRRKKLEESLLQQRNKQWLIR
jgi:hypothetical protein